MNQGGKTSMILNNTTKGALLIAIGSSLAACDALTITDDPLAVGAANTGNLLDQGGFDGSFGAWRACSDPSTVTLQSDREDGSAELAPSGCIYQTVPAQVNDNLMISCSARKPGTEWASISFGYLDANYQSLKTVEAPITGNNFTDVSADLRAPINTAYAEVVLYAEGGAVVDDCELTNLQAGLPEELLLNGYFEEGIDGWQTCANGSATTDNSTAIIAGSCISQKFTAYEGVQLSVTCDGVKTDANHAAVALGYLDVDSQAIGMSETPLTTQANNFPTVTLTAPANTYYAQVMIYAEGEANLNSCTLKEI